MSLQSLPPPSHCADMLVSLIVASCSVGRRPRPALSPPHRRALSKPGDRYVALLMPGRGPLTLVLCSVKICRDTVNLVHTSTGTRHAQVSTSRTHTGERLHATDALCSRRKQGTYAT